MILHDFHKNTRYIIKMDAIANFNMRLSFKTNPLRDSKCLNFKFVLLHIYRGACKSITRPTSPCILFGGENISFDSSLVIYI